MTEILVEPLDCRKSVCLNWRSGKSKGRQGISIWILYKESLGSFLTGSNWDIGQVKMGVYVNSSQELNIVVVEESLSKGWIDMVRVDIRCSNRVKRWNLKWDLFKSSVENIKMCKRNLKRVLYLDVLRRKKNCRTFSPVYIDTK